MQIIRTDSRGVAEAEMYMDPDLVARIHTEDPFANLNPFLVLGVPGYLALKAEEAPPEQFLSRYDRIEAIVAANIIAVSHLLILYVLPAKMLFDYLTK